MAQGFWELLKDEGSELELRALRDDTTACGIASVRDSVRPVEFSAAEAACRTETTGHCESASSARRGLRSTTAVIADTGCAARSARRSAG
jgi:hypothetical protein